MEMSTSMNLTKGLTALSLSLGLLAGCAAPTPTTPAPGAPAAPTPETAQPAAPTQPGAAPTMPAPAAVAPMTLTGTATFRGEPLAGYDVTVIDATTGQVVAQTNDLASAKGLAVSAQPKTDAKGQFSLQVVGLGAGQALRVQVASGNGRLETIVTANGQSLGARGYRLAQAGSAFTVTELTTAIARVAGNVIRTTQVLTPEAAAPLLAKLATEMAGLTDRLASKLQAEPGLANGLVSSEGTRGAEAVKTLVTNAGELAGLTKLVASLVADVSKAAATSASPAAADATVRAALAKIEFTGTVLAGALDAKGGFKLTNGINGQAVDAGSGDLATVTTQITPSGGSGGSSAVEPTWVEVANLNELQTALAGTASHIRLTGTIGQDYRGYRIQTTETFTINRAVVIDGNAKDVFSPIQVNSGGVTLKNATVWRSLTIGTDRVRYRVQELVLVEEPTVTGAVTFDAVTFKLDNSGTVQCHAPVNLTVKGCTFASSSSTALRYTASGGSLAVQGSHFTGVATFNPGMMMPPPFPFPIPPSVSWSGTGISVTNSSTSLTVDAQSTFTRLHMAIRTSGGTTSVSGSSFAGCQFAWYSSSSIDALGTAFHGNTLTQLDAAAYPGAINLGQVYAVSAYNNIQDAHATIVANNTVPAAWSNTFQWND
jgi:hypothetical protein